MLFNANTNTGGFGLASQMIDQKFGVSIGRAMLGLDGAVILLSAFAFDAEKAMFGLIAAFVTAKTIDVMQTGFGFAKVI